ncbi:MAG: 16S rRNA (cytosine(967)-C(5))-methyltransferase RsmB, partial [Oscillospiraceae bacterium]|nr:16S rRNA (cytosine(967)-C(5))-methyltransferase RsmB [Oscillospiraceae bacterium]
MTAREAALKSLSAYRQRGAYSSDALKAVSGELDSREAALASQLCFGVLQNMYLIDSAIARFSSVKPAKMEPRVLDILRISAYQLMFLDRIPASAAVNEAVKLTKKYSNPRASGLVNAVLRKISQNADALRNPDISGGEAKRLSVKYSHPEWLVNYYISALGANGAESTLRENNSAVPVYLQTNFVRATADDISA